ncbi:MAG: PDDEXK nuclease domain-containing protein [Planctomycetes bacterium]|nr:PDDEXK nuclease domain-containing protein [Planctomycetota bacterium]
MPPLPKSYAPLLAELKERVRTAQVKAALAVNTELIRLYWHIGKGILEAQKEQGWGAKVIDRLAGDLRAAFPDMRGFSPRNLKYMRSFAEAWTDPAIVQRVSAQLPWWHNVMLLSRLQGQELREWYARKAIQHGWSAPILDLQIETRLHEREGKAVTNFARTLPPGRSDLAQQLLKDPYTFDFLTIEGDAKERKVEKSMMDNVQKLLLELGMGFSFAGRQVRFEVGGDEFRIDLLFYHLKLRCFVVIDLKARPFEPEFAGKLNFYLAAVDEQMRHEGDAPTIGLLLVRGKRNRLVVEYALRTIASPMGVAEWTSTPREKLPKKLRDALPSVEQLEERLPPAHEQAP